MTTTPDTFAAGIEAAAKFLEKTANDADRLHKGWLDDFPNSALTATVARLFAEAIRNIKREERDVG